MLEQEWHSASNVQKKLDFLQVWKFSERKLQLFACGCCRRITSLFTKNQQRIIDLQEGVADGRKTEKQVQAAIEADDPGRFVIDISIEDSDNPADYALAALYESLYSPPNVVACNVAIASLRLAHPDAAAGEISAMYLSRKSPEESWQTALLHCIFGNPLRPLTVDPSWKMATVVSVAQAIYDDRAFDRMPILADALEEAGCTNADILDHCRQPSEYVRGCWVVDLLLDKK